MIPIMTAAVATPRSDLGRVRSRVVTKRRERVAGKGKMDFFLHDVSWNIIVPKHAHTWLTLCRTASFVRERSVSRIRHNAPRTKAAQVYSFRANAVVDGAEHVVVRDRDDVIAIAGGE